MRMMDCDAASPSEESENCTVLGSTVISSRPRAMLVVLGTPESSSER
jgi:hypothetical protein